MELEQVPLGYIVIDSGEASVVVGLADLSPTPSAGAGGWEAQARERRTALTIWRGRPPLTIPVKILFDTLDDPSQGGEIERDIRTLERMAGILIPGEPPVLRFNSGGVVPYDFHDAPNREWVISDLTLDSDPAKSIKNERGQRIRQEGVVTFMQYVAGEITKVADKRRNDSKKGKCKGSRVKRYKVKDGDTLNKIAKRFYGDSDCWRAIAKANDIRNPRNLKEGRTLRLP